jgi:hypothetical protein
MQMNVNCQVKNKQERKRCTRLDKEQNFWVSFFPLISQLHSNNEVSLTSLINVYANVNVNANSLTAKHLAIF